MLDAKEQFLKIKIDAKASEIDLEKVRVQKANKEDLDILRREI